MINLVSVLLAIILHSPIFLDAHALAKREHPLSTDTRDPIINLPTSWESLWPGEDGQSGYLQDYVKNTNEHPRSRLLPSLIDDSEGLERPHHLEIQPTPQSQPQESIPQVEQQQQEDHEEQYEKEEEEEGQKTQQDLRKQEEYDKQNAEQSKKGQQEDPDNFEEEYVKRQEEKYEKPEVHLFGFPGLPQQTNQNSRTVQSEALDLQKTRQDQPNAQITENNPQISRVERPTTTSQFSYIHPEQWSLDNPECSGRRQSPVNLDSEQLISVDVPSSLIWTGYWNQPQNLTITDNGHSVELSGTWDQKTPFISGGPLEGDYLFAQLHFHWGPKDSVGSEHTINNNSFPMEMHMVHYKKDYGTFSNALNHDDGLAVVAFLFEIRETPNFGINFLADSLSKIQNKPSVPFPVKPYPLAFLHFIFQANYASYIGSLTTPPCREIVTWLVSSRPLTISHKQMESFRKISNKWPEKENYRPQQALNGRPLYYVAH